MILLLISIIVLSTVIFAFLFSNNDVEWTQKDRDDGDKQYGFMCYACDEPLEDGEGIPRLCENCQKEDDDTSNQ
jgi:hypothetical protein